MSEATTTWEVSSLDYENKDGYVFAAVYDVTATKIDISVTEPGTIKFTRPESLLPFDDLTEEMVIGWIKAELNSEKEDTVENFEKDLYTKLDETIASVHLTSSDLPWQNTPEGE